MFERYEYITQNIRIEKGWWMAVKYCLVPALIGGVPTAAAFWLWIL